jgi:hypothetical protein
MINNARDVFEVTGFHPTNEPSLVVGRDEILGAF